MVEELGCFWNSLSFTDDEIHDGSSRMNLEIYNILSANTEKYI